MAIYTSTPGLVLKKKRSGWRKLVLSVYANCPKYCSLYTHKEAVYTSHCHLCLEAQTRWRCIYIYMVFPSCVPEMDFQYLLDIIQNGNPCKFCNANYIPSRFSYSFNKNPVPRRRDPHSQLQAAISWNLLQDLCKIIEYVSDTKVFWLSCSISAGPSWGGVIVGLRQ